MSSQQYGPSDDQDAGPPGNGINDLPGPHPDPPLDDDLNVTEENADREPGGTDPADGEEPGEEPTDG